MLCLSAYCHTAGMLLVVRSAMTLLHHSLKLTLHGTKHVTAELLQECYAAGMLAAGSDVLHLQTCMHSSQVCLLASGLARALVLQ